MARRTPRAPHLLKANSPFRLLTQIIALQTLYYISITVLTLFTALTAGRKFTAGLILDWRSVRGDTAMGWTMGVVWGVGGGLVGIILLLTLVARSKLVLDFVLTLHFIHLLITSLYTKQIPANLLWWALQAGSIAVMVAGGVWSCRWRELKPMAFGSGTSGGGKGPNGAAREEYELVTQEDREGRG